ncbi:hypothetical protein PMAYCL1PPCAC_01061, partial [Pristionchus mayeri]
SEANKDKSRRARLARFFSSFSRINNLVIHSFYDPHVFNLTMSTLGNLHIERIEVFTMNFDKDTQKSIVKFTEKHNIRYVTIFAPKCNQDQLQPFLTNLSKLGASVNIYERVYNKQFHNQIFN